MSRFEEIVQRNMEVLTEAPLPPAGGSPGGAPSPVSTSAPGGAPPTALPGMGGDLSGGAPTPPAGDEMGDDAKKEADPIQFTKSVLQKITEVTPDMFENYLNTFSNNFLKIKDKEQFKHYYRTFYSEMKHMFVVQDKLKNLFKQLQGDVGQLLTGAETTPDSGKGGAGKAGPSGPGVK